MLRSLISVDDKMGRHISYEVMFPGMKSGCGIRTVEANSSQGACKFELILFVMMSNSSQR